MRNLVLTLGLLASASAKAETEIQKFPTKLLKEVELRTYAGDLTVATAEGPEATLEITKSKFDKDCELTTDQTARMFTVTVRRRSKWAGTSCHVSFKITVPSDTHVRLRTGLGNIVVDGIRGRVDFRTGSGTVDIHGVIARLYGNAGSGNVEVHGLVGDAVVKTGSGNVELHYASLPSEGRIQITTASGYSKIYVPDGARFKTEFVGSRGELVNEVGDTPSARFSVAVRARSGNLAIKKNL